MSAQNSRTRGSKQTKKKQKSNSSVRLGSLLLLIIIGLGASGALFLAFGMMTTSVVVATENIRGNTQITSSMVTTKNISKGALPNNYISGKYLGSVVGSYTDVGITSGNVFTTGNIATKKSRKAAAITEGYTRMKINPSNIPNGIQVDDRINLLIQASLSEYGKAVIKIFWLQMFEQEVQGKFQALKLKLHRLRLSRFNMQLQTDLFLLLYFQLDMKKRIST